jgi:hypothetical protein
MTAAIGGTAEALGGGKFANGAVTWGVCDDVESYGLGVRQGK